MKAYTKKILCRFTIPALLIISLIVVGCGWKIDSPEVSWQKALPERLPTNMTNLTFIGNYWYTFELGGNEFMGHSFAHRQAITQVIEK